MSVLPKISYPNIKITLQIPLTYLNKLSQSQVSTIVKKMDKVFMKRNKIKIKTRLRWGCPISSKKAMNK